MNFQYKFRLAVPADEAWTVLMDVVRVAPCLPGAAIESGEGGQYVGRVKVKLGPIEMTYRGDVTFVERDDVSKHATINVAAKEMKGGGAAKATLRLDVVPCGSETEVNVSSEFTVSGKAAQFGRGVMEEVGEKLMSEFAARLSKLIAADREEIVAESAVASSAASGLTQAAPMPVAQDRASDPEPQRPPLRIAPQPAAAHTPRLSHSDAEDDVMDVGAAMKGAIFKRVITAGVVLAVVGALSAIALHSL